MLPTAASTIQSPVSLLSDAALFQLLEQAPSRGPVVFENANFRMEFDGTGAMRALIDKRTQTVRDIERLRGGQFVLQSRVGKDPWRGQVLDQMMLFDERRYLLLGDSARQIAFVFETDWNEHYLRFDLQRIIAPKSITLGSLSFEFCIQGRAKVYPLDYMTEAIAHGPRLKVTIPSLWGVQQGEHMGSFALTLPDDDASEDEALFHLWVDGWLPQPKVDGEWTLERARAWLADWQARYVDQSTMIVQPKSKEELYELCQTALSMGMRRIYLHTDVWRGEYWPRQRSFLHINREVFPAGESDLKALADSLQQDGVGLAVHTVSCVIGAQDPDYAAGGLDSRLASWVDAELLDAVDSDARTILIRPKNRNKILTRYEGGIFDPNHHFPFMNINCFQIGDEILEAENIRELEPGLWELSGCRRAIYGTTPSSHDMATRVKGLFRPYRQAFTADVESNLLQEIAQRFGAFFNRVGLSHMECDGLENHLSVPWGRSKFTWLLYQEIDHPTTSNTSSGSPLPWHIEYWFKSSSKVRANHPTGGVAGGEGVPLYLNHDIRPATGPYEIHLKPTERMSLGGESVHLMRPIPMFGISLQSLDSHGLSGHILDSIRLWKRALQSISDEQRQSLKVPYVRPNNPFPIRRSIDQLYRPVDTESGISLQAFEAVQPVGNGISWAWMQERGPNVPRSYFRVGEAPVEMEVPKGGRNLEFVLRVLPSFHVEDQQAASLAHAQRSGAKLSEIERGYYVSGLGKMVVEEHSASNIASGNRTIRRSLMPNDVVRIRQSKGHQFNLKQGFLSTGHTTAGQADIINADRPRWSVKGLEMAEGDGLRLIVFGDGSGSRLVVTLHSRGRRDFVFPIDFTGRRELWVPTDIASWGRGDWGWRFETTRFSYGPIDEVELGFGFIPAGAAPRVTIESIDLVSGYASEVNKLSLILGDSALQVDGVVRTGEYIWYQGGETVQVHDLNWNLLRTLPINRRGFEFEPGNYPIHFWAEDTRPHLELQMLSFGDLILIEK